MVLYFEGEESMVLCFEGEESMVLCFEGEESMVLYFEGEESMWLQFVSKGKTFTIVIFKIPMLLTNLWNFSCDLRVFGNFCYF